MSVYSKCGKCKGETVDYTCPNCQYDAISQLREILTEAADFVFRFGVEPEDGRLLKKIHETLEETKQ